MTFSQDKSKNETNNIVNYVFVVFIFQEGNYEGWNCRHYFLSTFFLTVCHAFLVRVDGFFYEQASINKKLTKKQNAALLLFWRRKKEDGECYWVSLEMTSQFLFLFRWAQYCSWSEISNQGQNPGALAPILIICRNNFDKNI